MLFSQLKTLLWRNIILKKRGIVLTLLEIIVPFIIILIIAQYSKYENIHINYGDYNNSTLNSLDDINNLFTETSFLNQLVLDIVFSSDYNDQQKNTLLENIKSNSLFSSMNFIQKEQNFTLEEENIIEDYNEYLDNKYNDLEMVEDYNKPINKIYEYKVYVSSKELEMEKNYQKMVRYNEKYSNAATELLYYGIVFKSLSKYTIYFYYPDNDELVTHLKVSEDDYYRNEWKTQLIIIKNVIDKSLVKMLTNIQDFTISTKFMDSKGYTDVKRKNKLNDFIPFLMTFYFVPCMFSLLANLVIEKESRIKESLVIIGLKKSSFWISWAITYGIIITVSTILVTIAMYYFKLFLYIHFSVTFVVLIIFGLSCCCISFILSTMIKKARTANTISIMIIILFFSMYFLQSYLKKYKTYYIICSFILSPISFLGIFNNLITYEENKLPVTFITIFGNETLKYTFLTLIGAFILYLLIAIYLDNVLPQGNNFHKKWHFFITGLFHRKYKKSDDEKSNIENPYIEKDPTGLNKAVEVRNIRKNFKVKGETIEILKNINFNAYYDEIFAILGHNGAGKTTLMSIMTGILSSTRGGVYYDNIPITGNETDICKQFGYCPQFDTLNNNLTVGEHIKLFAGIKDVKIDVDEVLKNIDLLEKKNNFPKELSGGQKRKLCISLALLGSPKYVFLDEPTTGLDPYSRKNIWEILSNKKKGCVMFVTTHYMDEADLLADRKMIISNGNITCLGTSLFLKNKFNMNYSLDVHVKNMNYINYIDNIIDQYCPGFSQNKIISNTNNQVKEESNLGQSEEYIVTYLLPIKYSKSFKDIFEGLNMLIKDKRNSIENFSLTAPTLEELFIKLENNEIKSNENKSLTNVSSIDMNNDREKFINKLETIFSKTRINNSSFLRQVFAIIKIRLKIFLRNKTFAILYTLLPITLIVLSIYLENKVIKAINEPIEFDSININTNLYENGKWFKDTNSSGQGLEIIDKINNSLRKPLESEDYENNLTISSGKLTPDINYIGGFKSIGNDNKNLEFVIYKNATYFYSDAIGLNALNNAILDYYNVKEQIATAFKPFSIVINANEYNENDKDDMINIAPELLKMILEPVLIVGMALAISVSISIYGPLIVKEREDGITHQLYLNGTKHLSYWVGVLLSDSICILFPTLLIGVVGYFNDISIYNLKIVIYTIVATLLWIIGSLLNQYIISYMFKKYERASTLFIIINPILSLFIGIYALVIAIISNTVDNLNGNNEETSNSTKSQYIFYGALVLYFPAAIIYIYTKLSTYIIIKKITMNSSDIVSFMTSDDVIKIMNSSLDSNEKGKEISKLFFDKKMPTLTDLLKLKEGFVTLIIVAIVIIIIYTLILVFIEKEKDKNIKKNKSYTANERKRLDEKIMEGPNDVKNEWKKIQQSLDGSNQNNNIALKIYELNKSFNITIEEMRKRNKKNKESKDGKENNKNEKSAFQRMDDRVTFDKATKKYNNRIVDDVTFGVNVGECLGLLGPNGAGKTTSISMITGILSHTHGKIVYGNHDLNETKISDLSLGYCSQHDSLWKLLTVKETIQFYLNICGYPKKDIPHFTKALTEACGIEIHRNKKVREISGGTKRKLSLIIAICSSPNYLILDEPSAGMDPFTRRYMWKLITELKNSRETATILTTHSTEEAEALCDRIAILIKGRLVCIDTPRSIKMNHNNCYTLEVFTDHPEQFEKEVVKNCNLFGPGETYELESFINYQKYTVTMKIENIANVFSVMEEAKENGIVKQYNFGQYSLEQVFINFVNNTK
ncbi:hypothetical protein BCR36DRAFT_325611 [Piromyces finnis]|uniref:ABC transporter domain-containing protein n=1 Tax=Piromyces finnis TaxID=1754191 RepID=A0A1Y1VAJ7_9FUNG|nr:hypothetical protein BCR36DRAFT_325611 [Piromyces finnis]|eukprot:ORX51392.1 hypothetical protein BCR36DRAFT_325611 [Piromyces finnis]